MNETISRIELSISERIIYENYLGAEYIVEIISLIFLIKRCLVKYILAIALALKHNVSLPPNIFVQAISCSIASYCIIA